MILHLVRDLTVDPYIDRCVHRMHGNVDDYAIIKLMQDMIEHEARENGKIPDVNDYLTIKFMEYCYMDGKESQRMNSHDFANCHDRHDEEVIEKVLIRIIKAVLDYEKE